MDKETWCTRYLSEESPECLPLPDGREPGGWGRQALSLATESDVAELSASLLLLLGLAFCRQPGTRIRVRQCLALIAILRGDNRFCFFRARDIH